MSEINRKKRLAQIQLWIKASQDNNGGKFTEEQERELIRKCMLLQGITLAKAREYMDLVFGREIY